jgi:hypothetical protein
MMVWVVECMSRRISPCQRVRISFATQTIQLHSRVIHVDIFLVLTRYRPAGAVVSCRCQRMACSTGRNQRKPFVYELGPTSYSYTTHLCLFTLISSPVRYPSPANIACPVSPKYSRLMHDHRNHPEYCTIRPHSFRPLGLNGFGLATPSDLSYKL